MMNLTPRQFDATLAKKKLVFLGFSSQLRYLLARHCFASADSFTLGSSTSSTKMELTTGVIVGSIVVIVVVIYHLKRLKLYRAAAQFAGPTTWPLIGNINLGIGLDIDGKKKKL